MDLNGAASVPAGESVQQILLKVKEDAIKSLCDDAGYTMASGMAKSMFAPRFPFVALSESEVKGESGVPSLVPLDAGDLTGMDWVLGLD